MSESIAIELKNIGKAFEIYSHPSDRLKQIFWPGGKSFHRKFWAVSNITLDIYKGETVGIVGKNGSGKSTLLQIICGILQPTAGSIEVRGRLAPLLELGSGFNPEFTGRENVFLKAAILGLSRKETENRFEKIESFADIGKFIDEPVKSYSSGMYARLAFAVAINVDPDILVVDEALSVGDEAFQRKCFSRIEEIRESGSTVLFVSHSASKVVELCDRAILMDQGNRLLTANPKTVISKYQKLIYAPNTQVLQVKKEIQSLDLGLSEENEISAQIAGPPQELHTSQPNKRQKFDPGLQPESTVEYCSKGAQILDVYILDQEKERVNILIPGKTYTYSYKAKITHRATNVRCGMMIKTKSGLELGGVVTHPRRQGISEVYPGLEIEVQLSFKALLSADTYFANAGIIGFVDGQELYLHRILDAVMFRVEQPYEKTHSGYVDLSTGSFGHISVGEAGAEISQHHT